MHFKVSSGKWRPFCLGLNVLTTHIYNFGTRSSWAVHEIGLWAGSPPRKWWSTCLLTHPFSLWIDSWNFWKSRECVEYSETYLVVILRNSIRSKDILWQRWWYAVNESWYITWQDISLYGIESIWHNMIWCGMIYILIWAYDKNNIIKESKLECVHIIGEDTEWQSYLLVDILHPSN